LRLQPGTVGAVPRTYNLKLLHAENCFNATSAGLADGLALFTSLVYLDLSQTYPARHPRVLETLKLLPCLQILKLRGIGLRDEDVSIISQAIGLRVRSLDVRDNRITDLGVRYILQNCITTTSQAAKIVQQTMMRSRGISRGMHEFFGVDLPSVYRLSYQDQYVYNLFTTGFFRPGVEDALGSGITHFYISGNPVSPSAISDLLHIQRLHVLDAGSLLHRLGPELSPTSPISDSDGIESLVPLFEKNGQNLTYLRLPYRIVTAKTAPVTQEVAELDGGAIPTPTINVQQPEAFELEGDRVEPQELPAEPIFELEGTGIDPESSARQNETRLGDDLFTSPLQRSTSEEAPEALFSPLSPIGHEDMFPQTQIDTILSTTTTSDNPSDSNSLSTPRADPRNRPRTYSGIIADHEARINFRKSRPHGLLPSMLPHLRTLALTDVPLRSWTRAVPDDIIAFVAACGEEAHWSRLRSQSTYVLPPGGARGHRSRASAEATYATSLFALRQVVLEMRPVRPASSPRAELKSSVEDPDCEAFWEAAAEDFSFFGSGGAEECGVLESELRGVVPLEVQMGKMLVGESAGGGAVRGAGFVGGGGGKAGEVVDVLAEISKFRREKKAAHQVAEGQGVVDVFIEGFWEGDIKVIRR
jgi:hypothetical protein